MKKAAMARGVGNKEEAGLVKKLVCFTGCLFSSGWDSVNYHLLLLLRAVITARGYEITVFSYEEKPVRSEQMVLEDAGFMELSEKVAFRRMDIMSPSAWMSQMPRADVILCQHYSFVNILKAVRIRWPQVRIVSWIHSVVQEELLSGSIYDKNDAYPFMRQQNAQVALSDLCVFDSLYDRSLGKLDFGGMGKSCVIYPVTEMGIYNRGGFYDTDCGQKPEILFIGRWDYRKGLDSLIPCSYRMFLEHGIKTVLLTEGDGEYVFASDAARHQFRNLVRSGGVKFEGWKSDKKAYAEYLLEKRRVAVFPSYYDTFNMAAYDCASLGIPLVVSNRCGIREVLGEGEWLAVCNPYDIELLYEEICSMCLAKGRRTEFGEDESGRAVSGQSARYVIRYGYREFERDIKEVFYRTVWEE